MKRISKSLFCLFVLSGLFAGSLLADSVQDATARMKERLVQIDQMKERGELGENAAGFLAARADLDPDQSALVDAENADRRLVYAAIAAKTGQTPEEVGRQRAVRIAGLARSGVWVQIPGGEWIRK